MALTKDGIARIVNGLEEEPHTQAAKMQRRRSKSGYQVSQPFEVEGRTSVMRDVITILVRQ